MNILSATEIRVVEQKCFDYNYYNEIQLMQKAGYACYEKIVEKYGKNLINAKINVFCGNGKNAGDGFLIARYLFSYGANVKIILCDKTPTIPEPLKYYNEAVSSRVPVELFDESSANADYIVDCIFGIGFSGEPRKPFDKVFEALSNSNATVISIDTPSGTNATTGEMCKNAIKADYTIAISTLKYCHILPPANENCGKTDVVDIGIPKDCYNNNYAKTIEFDDIKDNFVPVPLNANKGTNGHLLALCGSANMTGAAVICSSSAVKCGAGLVKITTPISAHKLIASQLNQPIFHPVAESDGMFSIGAKDDIISDLEWSNAVVLGCGIGNNESTVEITKSVLRNAKSPIILDADGINCINGCINILKDIKVPVVLTPHPGEMSRLVSKSIKDIQSNRIDVAKSFANEYGVVVVLKGANTVVTDGDSVFVNTTGNAGMAMGGTGDMLAGMIGAFVAEGMDIYNAAKAGVLIHGLSADLAIKEKGMRSITVFDMMDQLGTLMSQF